MAIPVAKQYILDFEGLGMGLFVHWGLYSQLGEGEWVFHHSDTPMDEYKKLKDTFTAEDFDAEKLCQIAKNAGCKYITLTTRHHEGFSLYDTCGLNDFDAPHSPAKRDLIREFVDACRKYDIVPFFYHTTLDWYDKRFNEDFDAYLEYLRKSVEILCTNYGKIGGLWFDGNWSKPAGTDWKEDELYATIRRHQPEAMIINNTGLDARGKMGNPEIDSVTFEQGRPEPMNRDGMPKYLAAEMCETLNNHWGIGFEDIDYKSPAEILKSLCESRRVGANYLVNIGPEAQGKVNSFQRELLSLVGRWMKIYGEAIYSGRPTDIKGEDTHFALKSVDGKHLYFFVYDLGIVGNDNVVLGGEIKDGYKFTGVTDEIESIKWMDEDEELEFINEKGELSVKFTGFHYGKSYPVRVAKAIIKQKKKSAVKSTLNTIREIGEKFRLPGEVVSYGTLKDGIINATYKVNYKSENGEKSYVFQRINTYVFKKPEEIMKNIDLVTSHIREKNAGKITLHYHHAEDGKNYVDGEDGFWRVMNCIDSVTYNTCESEEIIRKVGEAFGEFQMKLSDFDGSKLSETIVDFHNTSKRLDTLFAHVEEDPVGRVWEVSEEIKYLREAREKAAYLSDKYNRGEFPVRVAHNDTKCNNVLFSKDTDEPLVVIDLDTVMPGMAMYDFADAARFICATAPEDEPDLSKVRFDTNKFKAFSVGFLSKIKEGWTREEIDSLVLATFAITIELAVRFLDDYITGDKYFKINYEDHNAVRTRCQLKLAKDIMNKYDELTKIIDEVLKEI